MEGRNTPKRKIDTLSDENKALLFRSTKTLLTEMTELGGRDTEKDLFGDNGGYKTVIGGTRGRQAV